MPLLSNTFKNFEPLHFLVAFVLPEILPSQTWYNCAEYNWNRSISWEEDTGRI